MPTVTGNDGTETFYKDWGSGQPIVFSHGWPLSSDDWDNQMLFFVSKGYRVVAHDRRGHGRSAQVTGGHDMDHYADDLAAVTAHLDLRDAIHVGHSTADLLRFFRPWTRQRARPRRYRGVCSSHVSVVSATSRQRPSTGIEWPRPGNSR